MKNIILVLVTLFSSAVYADAATDLDALFDAHHGTSENEILQFVKEQVSEKFGWHVAKDLKKIVYRKSGAPAYATGDTYACQLRSVTNPSGKVLAAVRSCLKIN